MFLDRRTAVTRAQHVLDQFRVDLVAAGEDELHVALMRRMALVVSTNSARAAGDMTRALTRLPATLALPD